MVNPNSNPFKSAGNELGQHLPDSDAILETESHYIRADNQDKAQRKCEEIATEFDGIEPEVRSFGRKDFDCRFSVWRKPK